MLKAICYVSNLHQNHITELDKLLNLSKNNNIKSGITGLLIYKNGNFLQILEGKKEDVYSLYNKISLDNRHHHIIKILDTDISGRIFEDYETGFSIINSSKQINQLEVYLSWVKQSEIKCATKTVKLLETFIES